MTYQTVVHELVTQIPEVVAWDRENSQVLEDHSDLPYIIFGDLLRALLEDAIDKGRSHTVEQISDFLELASRDGARDAMLSNLIAIEIGEWLQFYSQEEKIAPLLGPETKRICQYVPGLATQRQEDRVERDQQKIGLRLRALWKKLRAD